MGDVGENKRVVASKVKREVVRGRDKEVKTKVKVEVESGLLGGMWGRLGRVKLETMMEVVEFRIHWGDYMTMSVFLK